MRAVRLRWAEVATDRRGLARRLDNPCWCWIGSAGLGLELGWRWMGTRRGNAGRPEAQASEAAGARPPPTTPAVNFCKLLQDTTAQHSTARHRANTHVRRIISKLGSVKEERQDDPAQGMLGRDAPVAEKELDTDAAHLDPRQLHRQFGRRHSRVRQCVTIEARSESWYVYHPPLKYRKAKQMV